MCQLEEVKSFALSGLAGQMEGGSAGLAGPWCSWGVLSSRAAGLHSPPLLGTAGVPGLVAPISNGFTGVIPFPNGHPTLETVYTNGLVPYSGTESRKRKTTSKKHPETSGTAISSSFLGSPHRTLFQALYLPGTGTHLAGGWGERDRTRVVPFAVLLMMLFSAAQSPSVAETLHPAFTGVQQYAGTSFPCLPQAPVWLTGSSGKQFVLSPRNPAVYPTTTITPIAQSIPQPPPILQQQQREGEAQGGNVSGWGGEQGVV